jgi:hypothetical protein
MFKVIQNYAVTQACLYLAGLRPLEKWSLPSVRKFLLIYFAVETVCSSIHQWMIIFARLCFNAVYKGLKFGKLTLLFAKSTLRYVAQRRVSTPRYAA